MSDKRRCLGSKNFGIEAHDAPISDFPVQPSQKDGLGRMCRAHWTAYTRALRQAATGKSPFASPEPKPTPDELSPSLRASLNFAAGISRQTRRPRTAPEPIRTLPARKRQGAGFPAAGSQGDAG